MRVLESYFKKVHQFVSACWCGEQLKMAVCPTCQHCRAHDVQSVFILSLRCCFRSMVNLKLSFVVLGVLLFICQNCCSNKTALKSHCSFDTIFKADEQNVLWYLSICSISLFVHVFCSFIQISLNTKLYCILFPSASYFGSFHSINTLF